MGDWLAVAGIVWIDCGYRLGVVCGGGFADLECWFLHKGPSLGLCLGVHCIECALYREAFRASLLMFVRMSALVGPPEVLRYSHALARPRRPLRLGMV